jgi:serine protease Do
VVLGRYRFLVGGDIIVAIDGHAVESDLDIRRFLYKKRPGDTVDLSLYRGSRQLTVKVRLEERR